MECVVRVDSGGEHVLLDRVSGVEYARGADAQVRALAHGVHTITDAPRLGPVQFDGATVSGFLQFVQRVGESAVFQGRPFVRGVTEWTGGVLYPDNLGIAFTERLADVPLFVLGVESHLGQQVTSVRGGASIALPGDDPLLGDWIRASTFDPDRLARRFARILGGVWKIGWRLKNPAYPEDGYEVAIDRNPGT